MKGFAKLHRPRFIEPALASSLKAGSLGQPNHVLQKNGKGVCTDYLCEAVVASFSSLNCCLVPLLFTFTHPRLYRVTAFTHRQYNSFSYKPLHL